MFNKKWKDPNHKHQIQNKCFFRKESFTKETNIFSKGFCLQKSLF